jgi:diadenosine tetraphosphate (Ap4A) HIT family hydrolase
MKKQVVPTTHTAYPVSPGHALVIPRRHIPSLFDATEPEQSALLSMVNSTKAIIDERHH